MIIYRVHCQQVLLLVNRMIHLAQEEGGKSCEHSHIEHLQLVSYLTEAYIYMAT